MFTRLKALMLLSECTGDDIWSVQHCRARQVPEPWIVELEDCFESGFDSDRHTIYVGQDVINQYQGLRDVDLAIKLGEYLGVDVNQLLNRAVSRRRLVESIQDAVEES